MPQTLSEAWRAHLGENWEVTHELLLHTLGNLTLTAYNSELSNSDFSRKKDLLQQSHLQLNEYFETASSWREEDIESRAVALANTAVQIWPYFGGEQSESQSHIDVKEKPRALTFLGQTYEVESWRDVLATTLNVIGDLDFERFKEIAESMPRLLGPDRSKFNSARELKNGMFANVNLSAKSINRFCLRVLEAAGIDPSDWVVRTD